MLRDKLAEYSRVRAVYLELRARYEKRRYEVFSLLEKAAEAKMKVLEDLRKAGVLASRLTAYQARGLGFIQPAKNVSRPEAINKSRNNSRGEIFFAEKVPAFSLPDNFKNSREIRACEAKLISMIDDLGNKLLRLDVLEMRCGEILLSFGKAMKVYDIEYRRVKRRVFPFGVASRIYKSLRRLWGGTYFSGRDTAELAVLGRLGADITKMAESPVF